MTVLHRLKRPLSLLLALFLLSLSLSACGGEKYPMRPSTVEEQEIVLTFGEDTVPFEVLHTFFTNAARSEKEYGDGYFDGDEGKDHFDTVMEKAIGNMAEIYALFAHCRSVGIDPYSEEIDEVVASYVEKNMEGGEFAGTFLPSFTDYDAYLEYLEKNFHMNDSVSRLLLRYAACEEALIEHYNRSYSYTREDVAAFFASNDCIRVNWFRQVGYETGKGLPYEDALRLMQSAQQNLSNANRNPNKLEAVFINSFPPSSTNEIQNGFYIGRYTWDPAYLGELTEMAFALSDHEVSEIFEARDGGLYLVYRLEKKEADFSSEYESIEALYLSEKMYEALAEEKADLLSSVRYAEGFSSLTAPYIMAN